jgi:IS5 family transposase
MAIKKNTPKVCAKSAAAPSRSNLRTARRALDRVAALEADAAYRAAFNAVFASAEIRSPALARSRTGTVIRMIRKAFEQRMTELEMSAANAAAMA